MTKTGPATAYSGDTLTFGFSVRNTGETALTTVDVADDRCAPVTRTTGDAALDPDETWTYACAYVLRHALGTDANPVVNIVKATGTDADGRVVTATDQRATTVLHPAVALVKSGPASAQAGDAVPYTLTVTNPGDVAFAAAAVQVSDPACAQAPVLQGNSADATAATLDPGGAWTYVCSVATALGQASVVNVAQVAATDADGHGATAQASFTTTLRQPAPPPAVVPQTPVSTAPATPGQQGLPQGPVGPVRRPGSARLSGPSGCVRGLAAVVVRGRSIARVVFGVDGRVVATVRRADARGRWMTRLASSRLRLGTHRVTATVRVAGASGSQPRTLRLSIARCRPAVVTPHFTG